MQVLNFMKLNYLIWLLLLCLLTTCSFAESNASQDFDKTKTCAACHGVNGVSNNPEWPNLAGQHASYLMKQLQDYKANKTRSDPTMSAFVITLSAQDIEDIAKYYSSLQRAKSENAPQNASKGRAIYMRGDLKKHITACIACHGPDGSGNSQAGFPLLAGQNVNYTVSQLKAFKEKRRHNDLNSIMHDISKRMTVEDMRAVAEYIRGF